MAYLLRLCMTGLAGLCVLACDLGTGGEPMEDATVGAGSGETCDALRPDDAEGSPSAILIRNEGAEPLYVRNDAACGNRAFQIEDADGRRLSLQHAVCEATLCDALAEGTDTTFRCGACPQTVIRIDPGASFEDEWSGVQWVQESVPAACSSQELAGQSCWARRLPAPGPYLVRAVASTELAAPHEMGECMPLGDGLCEAMGELGAAQITVEVPVQLPATMIELVFSATE